MKTFTKLEKQKQLTILNAAMKEFADKGYEQASTNKIVKIANIGKGMLFYYFKTKRDLYYFLIDYSLDFVEVEYLNKVDVNQTDFIERLKQAAKVKMNAYSHHPDLFHFLGSIFINEQTELPAHLQIKYERFYQRGYDLMYDNIDTSFFRGDVDVEKAFQLIRWSIDGYQHELITRLRGEELSTINFNPYWDEFFSYLEVLKKAFYTMEVES